LSATDFRMVSGWCLVFRVRKGIIPFPDGNVNIPGHNLIVDILRKETRKILKTFDSFFRNQWLSNTRNYAKYL